MRILVLGRSGQLAQSLLVAPRPGDVEMVAVGRPRVDLCDPATVRAAIDRLQPDVVINAAAYTAVDKAESATEEAFAVNAEGAAASALATAQAGIPLLHVSTDYVFDGRKPAPYVESDATGPIGVYGASKLEGERRVVALNPRHVIVRTSWVVSPFGSNFCKTMLRLAAERSELSVVGDQFGAPTYAIDLATALIAIAGQVRGADVGDPRWGIYHAANAGVTTWAGIAEATLAASQHFGGRRVPVRPITTADYPTPARRPANSRLDCSRIGEVFAASLPPWQDAIERCVGALLRPKP